MLRPMSALIICVQVKQFVPADGICGLHNSSIVSQVPGSRRVSRVLGDHGVEAGPGGLAGPSKQDGVAAAALHAWHSCLISRAHAHVCHLPPRQGQSDQQEAWPNLELFLSVRLDTLLSLFCFCAHSRLMDQTAAASICGCLLGV